MLLFAFDMWNFISACLSWIATAIWLKRPKPPSEIKQSYLTLLSTSFPLLSYELFQISCFSSRDFNVYISAFLPTILTPKRLWNNRIKRSSFEPSVLACLDQHTFLITFATDSRRYHNAIKFSNGLFQRSTIIEECLVQTSFSATHYCEISDNKVYRYISADSHQGPKIISDVFTHLLPRLEATLAFWNAEYRQLHGKVDLRRLDTSSYYYNQSRFGFISYDVPEDLAMLPILCNCIGWLEHAVEYCSPIFDAIERTNDDYFEEEILSEHQPLGW